MCGGSASGAWFAWGYNAEGQLALGDTAHRTVPTRVESMSSLGVASLSCGGHHVLALTSTCVYVYCFESDCGAAAGDVYAWGYNDNGELGLGHITNASTPQRVTALAGKDIARVVGSAYMSAAITGASLSVMLPVSHLGPAEGVLYMWGYNAFGTLGLGDTDRRHTPTVVSSLSGRRVVDVVSSGDHTVALTGAWVVCEKHCV